MLDGLIDPIMCFTKDPREATILRRHPTRLPWELEEHLYNIHDSFAASNPTFVIKELEDAVAHMLSEYENAFKIMIDFYQNGLDTGKIDGQHNVMRVQSIIEKAKALKKIEMVELMRIEIQVSYGYCEIQRFQEEIEKLEKKTSSKTEVEMLKDREQARKELIQKIMTLEREKRELIKGGLVGKDSTESVVDPGVGAENADEEERKSVEEILENAEPWKVRHYAHNKFLVAYNKWQHENPTGGFDGFLKSVDYDIRSSKMSMGYVHEVLSIWAGR